MTRWCAICGTAALGASLVGLPVSPAPAAPPPEDQCPVLGGGPGQGPAEDAAPRALREGMLLGHEELLLLRELLPVEVWRERDAFFHEGMRMEIGPCHRRYPLPPFFTAATQEFAGRASLDAEGNLRGYVAGLPFPPESIDPQAPSAAARWAWNFEHRYRGAGLVGSFRILDLPGRLGSAQTYEGSFFFLKTQHRADLKRTGYAVPESEDTLWIAGGRFDEPFLARHLAWRQSRPLSAQTDYDEPDDTFVYVPTMRKVRRASSTWVDGVFTPRYRVSGDAGGGGLAIGGNDLSGPSAAINPTAAEAYPTTEHIDRGFRAIALRPNAYVWRMLGEREVLAPLNGVRPGYPLDRDRNYGPSGLSVGSDRWEVRQAVVIEGASRQRGGKFDRLTLYIDYQTQQPLYVMTRRSNGRLLEVGIPVHRFSGDVLDYPLWPDGQKAYVFDPVASVFYDTDGGGSGWRRESYDVRSVPPGPKVLRRITSTSFLMRGH